MSIRAISLTRKAFDFLHKPITTASVLLTIRQLARRWLDQSTNSWIIRYQRKGLKRETLKEFNHSVIRIDAMSIEKEPLRPVGTTNRSDPPTARTLWSSEAAFWSASGSRWVP